MLDVMDPGGQRLGHFRDLDAFEIRVQIEAFAGSLLFFSFFFPCLIEALGTDLSPGRDPGYLGSQVIGLVARERWVAHYGGVEISSEEFSDLPSDGDLSGRH